MKHNTDKPTKQLPPAITRMIVQTQGLAAEIARNGGMDRAFVSRVLSGARSPSRRFLNALAAVLLDRGNRFMNAAAGVELAQMICEHKVEIAKLRS